MLASCSDVVVGSDGGLWSAPSSAASESLLVGGLGALPAYLATAFINTGAAVVSLPEDAGLAAEDAAFDEIVMSRALGLVTLVSGPGSCVIPSGVINSLPCEISHSRAGS